MSNWTVVVGDILDVEADVLVCSANPFLTLSGGVGGAFLLRYGPQMQDELHSHLDKMGIRHVPPGTVLTMQPCGSPYRAVLHAVAVDAFYDSAPDLITKVAERVLACAEQVGCKQLVLPALATGYGKLTVEKFAEGIRPLVSRRTEIIHVFVCVRHGDDADRIRRILGCVVQ
jgi:O-acetyl-ADP-ribose deacetylase (regulator of RNase III)